MLHEEVFEYDPGDASAEPEVEVAGNQDADVISTSLRVGAAFALFDAASLEDRRGSRARPPVEGYEAPRARLARLQRETDELRAELEASPEAYDGASGAELARDVDALVAALERIASGLPPRSACKPWEDLKRAAAEATSKPRSLSTLPPLPATPDDVPALGRATAELLDDASKTTAALPASVVTRLAALRSLHDQGAHFAARLRTVELEQRSLRDVLQANDVAAARIAAKLDGLLQALSDEPKATPPSSAS